MIFIGWAYTATHEHDENIYRGFQNMVSTHKLPRDQESLELLTKIVSTETKVSMGFDNVACDIISLTKCD